MMPIPARKFSLFVPRWTCAGSLLALAAGLVGCASVTYDPVLADSPRPATSAPACNGQLGLGATCIARVQADQLFTSSTLQVEPGQAYEVKVAPYQVWYDAGRRNVPPHGEHGSGLMNLFQRLRRHDAPWFTLMGVVTDPRVKQSLGCSQDLSGDGVVHVRHSGVLALYPNDALPRMFYANNSGQIWVFIKRVSREAVVSSPATGCHAEKSTAARQP